MFKQQLLNQDALLFVDNQAVCSALVPGSSSSDDISYIVSLCHLVWAALRAIIWLEYVPSDDNPSDGFSRDGIKDEWTQAQALLLGESVCVPLHEHHAGSLVSAVTHSCIGTLVCIGREPPVIPGATLVRLEVMPGPVDPMQGPPTLQTRVRGLKESAIRKPACLHLDY